jgi:hypothetical protein
MRSVTHVGNKAIRPTRCAGVFAHIRGNTLSFHASETSPFRRSSIASRNDTGFLKGSWTHLRKCRCFSRVGPSAIPTGREYTASHRWYPPVVSQVTSTGRKEWHHAAHLRSETTATKLSFFMNAGKSKNGGMYDSVAEAEAVVPIKLNVLVHSGKQGH